MPACIQFTFHCTCFLVSDRPDSDNAKLWRLANKVLSKSIDAGDFFHDALTTTSLACTVGISIAPGSSAPCQIPVTIAKTAMEIFLFVLRCAIRLSEGIYHEVITVKEGIYGDDRLASIYENGITTHSNVVTTFAATQQLKIMLGEISEGIQNLEEELSEDEQRRLTDCKDTTEFGFVTPCSKVSCEDRTRFCDGSFNFQYVASLRGGEVLIGQSLDFD